MPAFRRLLLVGLVPQATTLDRKTVFDGRSADAIYRGFDSPGCRN